MVCLTFTEDQLTEAAGGILQVVDLLAVRLGDLVHRLGQLLGGAAVEVDLRVVADPRGREVLCKTRRVGVRQGRIIAGLP